MHWNYIGRKKFGTLSHVLCGKVVHISECLLLENSMHIIGVGMTCTLGGLIQYHVQFMCSKIACLIYDQANIGGAIAPPAPMVPTPMHMYLICYTNKAYSSEFINQNCIKYYSSRIIINNVQITPSAYAHWAEW